MEKNNIYQESIYKENFYKQIRSIVGNPKSFIKMNKIRRKLISEKLKELALFSEFTNTFKNKDVNLDQFEKELNSFHNIYEKELNKIIVRKDSSEFVNQLNLSISTLIDYCNKKGYIFNNVTNEYVLNKLNSEKLFYIILSTCISSLDYIPFSNNEEVEKPEKYEINRLIFSRKIMENLLLHIIVIILENNEQGSSILSDVYRDLPNIIYDKETNLSQCFIRLSYQLIDIFNEIFEFNERKVIFSDKYGKPRSYVYLMLPKSMYDLNVTPAHIPEITEPDIDFDEFISKIEYSKRIKNGYSDVILSKETKNTLNIAQKKKFRINKNAISLFEEIDLMSYDQVKNLDILPFVPIAILINIENEIKFLQNNIDDETIEKIREIYKSLKKKEFITNINQYIQEVTGINIETVENCNKLYHLKKEYKLKRNLRQIHNTIITFAKIFDGFPIYFINSYDYRLRMYSWNYFFNRASGIYKYLVIEEPKKINKDGLITMITAYYNKNNEKIEEFESIKDESIEFILKWFQKDPIEELFKKDSFVYYELLGREITELVENKLNTGYLIEIDQKSSASVLYSIILGDKKLSEMSNLINTSNKPSDPIIYIMEESKKFFKDKISDESYLILTTNRKLHKYLFMCYIYNQEYKGRLGKLQEYLKSDEDQGLIASLYPSFINEVFPSLSYKKKQFNNITEFYLKKTQKPISIETLDNSIIEWAVFNKNKTKNQKIRIKNPIKDKYISYDYVSLDSSDINLKKTIRGILPSLIHSIDGAIMRLIIMDIYNKNNYLINHLHDSIQFHPNFYKEVLESINNVYTSDRMKDILKEKYLNRLRKNLLRDDLEAFDELEKKIYENFENISISSNTFKPEMMFPFE